MKTIIDHAGFVMMKLLYIYMNVLICFLILLLGIPKTPLCYFSRSLVNSNLPVLISQRFVFLCKFYKWLILR